MDLFQWSGILGLAVVALAAVALRLAERARHWRGMARKAIEARNDAWGERDDARRELSRLRGKVLARSRGDLGPVVVPIDTTLEGMIAARDELRARFRSAPTGTGAA